MTTATVREHLANQKAQKSQKKSHKRQKKLHRYSYPVSSRRRLFLKVGAVIAAFMAAAYLMVTVWNKTDQRLPDENQPAPQEKAAPGTVGI